MAFPQDVDPDSPGPHDALKLAFGVWISRLITDADGFLDLSEIRLLNAVFPQDLLRQFGLKDAQGNDTGTYDELRVLAARELRHRLPLEERLELVTIFHAFCMADAQLQQAELLVLREAAEALDIGVRELSQHLNTLRS